MQKSGYNIKPISKEKYKELGWDYHHTFEPPMYYTGGLPSGEETKESKPLDTCPIPEKDAEYESFKKSLYEPVLNTTKPNEPICTPDEAPEKRVQPIYSVDEMTCGDRLKIYDPDEPVIEETKGVERPSTDSLKRSSERACEERNNMESTNKQQQEEEQGWISTLGNGIGSATIYVGESIGNGIYIIGNGIGSAFSWFHNTFIKESDEEREYYDEYGVDDGY